MATTGELFEAVVSYYSNLAYRSLGIMRSTQQEIRTEQFDFGRLAARTMSFWFDAVGGWWSALQLNTAPTLPTVFVSVPAGLIDKRPVTVTRSEEHTSELQSRENLVCRLLLEKK